MRALSKTLVCWVFFAFSVATPITLHAEDLIPADRFILSQDADLPGGDIATMFDTTIEACENACLARKECTHFTYNTRNGSCFPKANPADETFFQGAFSGRRVATDDKILANAAARRAELTFVNESDMNGAYDQARTLANQHTSGQWAAREHLQAAREAKESGNLKQAINFTGAALNVDDAADVWVEYSGLLLDEAKQQDNDPALHTRAYFAGVNGYLRSKNKAMRHSSLVSMALALEVLGRGDDMVKALRLAQDIQPRDDTAAMLDTAAGKYGFRITDNEVQADTLRPRICATFSEDLAKTGVDYGSYVQLPATDMTVTTSGNRQLCVEGLQAGNRYTVTFREGLPAADGQPLLKSVPISGYVKDRTAGVRFPGRAYILPKGDNAALPVETVNADKLDLTLFQVSDRNLLRSLQSSYFGAPMSKYAEPYFSDEIGAELWQGKAKVAMEVNKDMTTRLPLAEAIKGLPAGIYALKAAIPGVDIDMIPAAWQWFVISDLGVTSMLGNDGLHVFVRALGDASAKAEVSVELLSQTNSVLGTVQTDDQGYAHFDAGLTRGTGGMAPALIVVRQGEADVAFLSLTDPEFDLSDRGVEGREAAPPIDVFLTTDRGAYRAGETVYATALSRDAQAAAITGLPLTAVVQRPDGVEYSRQLVQDGGAGGHVFALPIAGSAPRGVWKLQIYADVKATALTSKTFLVEDFLPERIDFALTVADTPLRLGDFAEISLDAKYLFGAPAADLAIEGEVLLRAAPELKAFPGYVFGLADAPFSAQIEPLGEGNRTDDAGHAEITASLPEITDPARPLEARVTLRVSEGSGRPVERQITKALTPSAPMIGIKPLFDGVAGEGSEAAFSLIGVGTDEKPAPMQVKWTLTRIETNYQWYQSYGNWNWEPVVTREPVKEGTLDLGTEATQIAAPVQWGEYELLVERVDGMDAASSTTFYAGWYAPADASASPDTLEVSLDKPAYKSGDTATLRLVPRAAGTALVTVVSTHLIAMQAVQVTEGENTITLPVTDEWGAGAYVTASVIRPMDVAAGRNPSRALGLAYAGVDPGARALDVSFETAPEAAPRGPMQAKLRVKGLSAGDTAYATVAAVDLGILNLTGFSAPDPKDHYFGQRKLGMGLRDVYGRLIDGLNGAEGEVRSGGDAGAQARLQAPPPTEELVAYFTGPVQVDADGLAEVSFDLPSFNGTVKLMAVVWSEKSVGQANIDVLVRDPVVVTASLPRFMAPLDDSRLLLEIVHATGPTGKMALTVTSDAGLVLGEVPASFDLGDKAKAVFEIPVRAETLGLHEIEVTLTTPDGKALRKTLTLPVQNNDPEVSRLTRLDLAAGQTFTFDANVFADLVPGSGRASLAVGPIARLNAAGLLQTLDSYPYGCTEQVTSKALPLIYFDAVAQAMQLKGADNLQARIDSAITSVLQNQTSEGAFGLWYPASGDFWLDAYVTDFLSRARAQGYAVPDGAFRAALDNLRNQVNYEPDFDNGGEALAYALMVLAREGAAAIGDLRYYADVKSAAFATPMAQAQLGAALASYGDQTRADEMFRLAANRVDALATGPAEQIFRADYGTNDRDTAGVLALALEAGSKVVDADKLTSRLVSKDGWSTQESTWALLATKALLDQPAEGITFNGAAVEGPLVRVMNATGEPIEVANTGKTSTQITVATFGVPAEPEPAGGNGYAITRSYYSLAGDPVDVSTVGAGTRLLTVLEVTPFGKGEGRLMVADPLPAGFEIDNPNLLRGGDVPSLAALDLQENVAHSEFRQDRFLTAVERYDNATFRLGYVVRAVTPGHYHHPAATVEDMYRPDFRARTDAGEVTITK